MRPRPSLVACLLALVPSAGPLLAQRPAFADAVDAVVEKHLRRPGAVGLSVGVSWRGATFGQGYGLADAEFDVPANDATMFRIGSITKQFTAALVMRLVEQGKVALEDASVQFVPEFATGERTVTVHQLLNHTSGIPSYTDIGEPWTRVWALELTHQQLLDLVRERPFDFAPGQDWRYNNTGYYLLGMLLENVNHKSYPDQIAELAAELGLQRTRYDDSRELIKNRAQGYDYENGKLSNDLVLGMSQPGAAGGLISTGADLVRWGRLLATGKVVRDRSYARMCSSEPLPGGRDPHYGFGLVPQEFCGRPRIGHGGGIFGFNSELFWLPGEDFYVAVVSNGASRAGRIADEIARAVLGIEDAAPANLAVPPELRAALAGAYDFADIGMGLKVFEQDGQLVARGDGQEAFGLLYQGEGEFRASFDASVRLVFAKDGRSLDLFQGGRVAHGTRK